MSQRRSLLIVEDVDEMRLYLRALFESHFKDWSVHDAAHLWEARERLLTHRPDLVLLDELLPGESLEASLQLFREHAIPILVMTGSEVPPGDFRVQKPELDTYSRADEARFIKAIESHLTAVQ